MSTSVDAAANFSKDQGSGKIYTCISDTAVEWTRVLSVTSARHLLRQSQNFGDISSMYIVYKRSTEVVCSINA